MKKLKNYYSKGQHNYPPTVKKAQAMLTAWEGDKLPVHGSNEGLAFNNVVNDNNGNGDAAGDSGTHESGGQAAHRSSPDTQHCYYCKKERHLNPDYLKLKANRASKDAKNAEIDGVSKAGSGKGDTNENAHTIMVYAFENFDTGAEDHFFFSQMVKKFINLPNSWLLIDRECSIEIIPNKEMAKIIS